MQKMVKLCTFVRFMSHKTFADFLESNNIYWPTQGTISKLLFIRNKFGTD